MSSNITQVKASSAEPEFAFLSLGKLRCWEGCWPGFRSGLELYPACLGRRAERALSNTL